MTFESTLGSAAGGFLGVTLFFLVRLWVEVRRSQPNEVKTYLFGNSQNRGQQDESKGELMHHHGRPISNKSEYKELGINNPLWEWTRDRVGRDSGACVVYGPYSTDCTEPGLYSAIFIIRGIGFSRPAEIFNDFILLELDVNKTIPQYSATEEGVKILGAQYKVARKFIKASELARGGWQKFELPFYSDASGVWEYRVVASDGLDNKPDNISRFGTDVRILFDKIIIQKINKFRLPWV